MCLSVLSKDSNMEVMIIEKHPKVTRQFIFWLENKQT